MSAFAAAGSLSSHFQPQSQQYFSVAPHPSNYFLMDSLDGFLSRPPSGPHIPAQSSHPNPALARLNYLSLSSYFDFLTKHGELVLDLLDDAEATDVAPDEDDPIPEFEDITVCQTPDGQVGSCVSPTECSSVSGVSSSPCSVPSVSGDLTCCVHTAQCSQESANLVTYFKNPDYPVPTFTLPSCPISIELLPDMCQVRMDFLHLSLSPSTEGLCNSSNSLIFSTSPGGEISRNTLCGTISDGSDDFLSTAIPHLYAHFDLSTDPYPFSSHHLNFLISVTEYPSTWNIRVAQIPCHTSYQGVEPSPLVAMSNCSQWYSGLAGTITSLSLLDQDKQFKACIKPDPTTCAVKYTLHSVVCSMEDQVQIMGLDMVVCGGLDGKEVVVPAGEEMGLVVRPGSSKQGDGVASYRVGYSLLQDCSGLTAFGYSFV
eukprot:GFUD01017451.1.p1 GENE.GFUD01017451.1~~GFUD01017451.1.p1  ORF type:complete len:428 (-),score=112.47 GFUD01017451.1:72-1355(-)